MDGTASRVVIGMDPHKRSVMIEVMSGDERIVGTGRFATDRDGHAAMRRYVQACMPTDAMTSLDRPDTVRPEAMGA